ncbi:efflux RND transporter periplasmic adaptor subunit [uncultured Agrobacterium sp.]|uniref:efflux RND transporter periplasmic adaptor subunit n=1 Tax=uncultured Agrobacterium sp. TaxID=157277 RepID=UPI0025DC62B6|nr:efflux RND transporter periplasmic adaptor subunit [uncultured Agrobacterium sp.]
MKHIVSVLLIAGAGFLTSCSQQEGEREAESRQVRVVTVKSEQLTTGGAVTGEIRARVETDLSFRVGGKIIDRKVDVGDHVMAGQVLARIDAQEQQADLAVAQANLEAATAQRIQAELAFARQQKLFDTQVTARSALDQAQEALSTAQGSERSAEAQLGTAKEALSYTELKAERDGVITARNAEVGQVAQAASAIFTLAQDGPRDAIFEVVETLFLGRPIKHEVTITLLSDPTKQVTAKVREISPTIDSSTGTVRVKVGLPGDGQMPLGAAVKGEFQYEPQAAIVLPWSAMSSKDGRPAVWVVDPASSKVALRVIEVEDYETGHFIVKQGLKEGEIVVFEGAKFLRPDEKVAPKEVASR